MNRSRRSLLLGTLLVLLAVGSLWLNLTTTDDLPRGTRRPHTPDYWVEGTNALLTDKEGRPVQRLQAPLLHHYPDDQSTEIQEPLLLIYEPDLPPWHVHSERGWISPDGELVLLQGEVVIDREPSARNQPLHLITRDLRVQPKEEYAETDQPVRAESGANWVEAHGLRAWLRSPVRIKLLADVKAYYEGLP